MKTITPDELNRRMNAGEKLKIVDVRMPFEFKGGHIPGAVNLPLSSLGDRFPDVAGDETIVAVCQGGMRSASACQKVEKAHGEVFNLVGGTSAWKSAGLPVEVPERPKASSGRRVDRQTHFVASLIILAAFYLSYAVAPAWIYLAGLPAFGLMLDATTGICPMTLILKKMPWNA